MGPSLAVVVVTHDSAAAIGTTLRALLPQLADGDELVVVDTASADATLDAVRDAAPDAEVLALEENLGFAGGASAGARRTTAPLLLFLNPDSTPEPGCIDALRACAAGRPLWGAWQALVLQPDGTVNSAGNPVHFLGFAWAGQHGAPADAIGDEPYAVASASGAALTVRREAWDGVGGFDERYFMYGEDVDLSLRLRLAGWRVGLAPAARVVHDYAFAKGDYKWFHLERNRWWTILGTYPRPLLLLLAPALAAFEVALLPVAARGGWLRPKLRAQAAVLRALPAMLARRRAIQATARIAPGDFAGGLTARTDSPFLDPIGRLAPVRVALHAAWRLVRALLGPGSRRARD